MNLAGPFNAGLMGAGDKTRLDFLFRTRALVTPEDFGAKGGSSTPGASSTDNLAVQKMFDSGKPCLFDQYYSVDTAIIANYAASQVGAYIEGFGTRSGLVLKAGGRVSLEGMNPDNPIGWQADQYCLQNLAIFVDYNSGNVPLTLKAAGGDSGSHSPGVDLKNVNIIPTSTLNGGTGAQLELVNIRQGSLDNVSVAGRYGAYQGLGIVHTVLEGGAPVEIASYNTRAAHLQKAFVVKAAAGATANDDAQGHHWTNCTALAVDRGWDLDGGPEGFGEWSKISGGHAYFREIGVFSTNYGNIHAEDIYLLGHGALATIQGIAVTGTSIDNYLFLKDNRIRLNAATGATRIGINTPAAYSGSAAHNRTTGATHAYDYMQGVTSTDNT